MTMSFIDLADVGTTREAMLCEPPRGVRNLIVAAGVVVASLILAMGFLRVQQSETLTGLIVAEEPVRAQVAPVSAVVAEVLHFDGQTVEAGQTVVQFDAVIAEARLAVIRSEAVSVASDLNQYRRLRQAISADANPFDPVSEAYFYFKWEQYKQQLAQTRDTRAQQESAQISTRSTAQAVLDESRTSLAAITGRGAELMRLAQAIRTGTEYNTQDPYCAALHYSYQQGRPEIPSTEYDATFLVRIEGQIADLGTQQSAYHTEIARLEAQLATPDLDPSADDTAYVTAQFALSITATEQELHQRQASLKMEAMSLELEINQLRLTTPVAGTIEFAGDWQSGDLVQAGQVVFSVVPPATRSFLEVTVPARVAPHLDVDLVLPCELPATIGKTPTDVQCQVERLSAAYQVDENGHVYYIAGLTIEPASTPTALQTQTIIPGMPMTITLPIRETTALRWLGEKIGFLEAP